MSIVYEWVIETMDEHGDIEESRFAATFADATSEASALRASLAPGQRLAVGLMRDRYDLDDPADLVDRQYAYLDERGALPPTFDGGARVPARFHKERASIVLASIPVDLH